MSNRALGQIPGARFRRATYTWQRRKGSRAIGLFTITTLCLLALFVGSTGPHTWSTGTCVWTYTGERPLWGEHISTLAMSTDNRVTNAHFALGATPEAIPGWTLAAGHPGSAVRSAQGINTPPGTQLLEIEAQEGDQAVVSQWVEVDGGSGLTFAFSAYAPDPGGDARVWLRLTDTAGRLLGVVGWALVGDVPSQTAKSRWFNYTVSERTPLTVVVDLDRLLQQAFRTAPERLGRVGIFFYTADRQHLLVEPVYLGNYPASKLQEELAAVAQTPLPVVEASGNHLVPLGSVPPTEGFELSVLPAQARVGDEIAVKATLTNTSTEPLGPLTVELDEPNGFGLIADGPATIDGGVLAPGETREFIWSVKAIRPHSVNSGEPWPLGVTVGLPTGDLQTAVTQVEVEDPRPGRLFYVLGEKDFDDLMPTPALTIRLDQESVESANVKVAATVGLYAGKGEVQPGVHTIVAFTPGLVKQDADRREPLDASLSALEQHLAYVNDRYVAHGLVEFATPQAAIEAWLDYSTPTLVALRGPVELRPEPGVYEFPIRLLGHDIPIGGRFRHEVSVEYPSHLADSIAWVGIYRDGELVAEYDALPTEDHTVTFTVDKPGAYRMLVIEFLEV